MELVRSYDLKVSNGAISLDDCSLLTKFNRLTHDVKEKKAVLDTRLIYQNDNDYLSVAVARLAYEFTKEEYNALYSEVVKRGLLQVS